MRRSDLKLGRRTNNASLFPRATPRWWLMLLARWEDRNSGLEFPREIILRARDPAKNSSFSATLASFKKSPFHTRTRVMLATARTNDADWLSGQRGADGKKVCTS